MDARSIGPASSGLGSKYSGSSGSTSSSEVLSRSKSNSGGGSGPRSSVTWVSPPPLDRAFIECSIEGRTRNPFAYNGNPNPHACSGSALTAARGEWSALAVGEVRGPRCCQGCSAWRNARDPSAYRCSTVLSGPRCWQN
eukprot:9503826-Pyramimonas_sp.AAC.2